MIKKAMKALVPNPGTLIVLALFLWAQAVGAVPGKAPAMESTTIPRLISYQGRLTDAVGDPVANGNYRMVFSLYCTQTGGEAFWFEDRDATNKVPVSDGFFNVLLGQLEPLPTSFDCPDGNVYLGIRVDPDPEEMDPRELLASVPYAFQAVEVPDGSITTEKIMDGAVTQAKLGEDVSLEPPDGSITTEKLADDAVTSLKIAHQFGASGKQLLNFVPRTGATGWDYSATEGNDQWHDLDLSSIVGDSAVMVKLKVAVSGATWGFAGIRKNGDTEEHEEFWVRALEGGDSNEKHAWHWQMIDVACDENQIIEYRYHWGGFTGPKFRLLVVGWWEPAHQ
jgi:hypothetical protein